MATGAEVIWVSAVGVPYCNLTKLNDGGLPTLSKKELRRDKDEMPLYLPSNSESPQKLPDRVFQTESPEGTKMDLEREQFNWAYMTTEMESYCQSCLWYIQQKTLPARAASMNHPKL